MQLHECVLIPSPAAAVGSCGLADFAEASTPGLRGSLLSGLRCRADSDCRVVGDRERRSNRDCRRGSGSV